MRILVIGGTGFVGRHVVRRLARSGHAVTVFHRDTTRTDLPDGVATLLGDRDALAAHAAAFCRLAPDVVLDVIPYTEQQARDLVNAFRELAGRLVIISSGDVYRNYDGLRGHGTAPPDPVPLAEDAPLRTSRHPYRGDEAVAGFLYRDEYDKILVEQAVMGASGISSTVLRLPAVYGPGGQQHRLWPYLKRVDDGRPALHLGEVQARWCWTRGYVENVAASIALAVTDEQAAGRVYNVGPLETLTEQAWVEAIGAAVGWTSEVVTVPDEHLPEHLRQDIDRRYHLALDTRRIHDELGIAEPVSHDEALRRAIAWERAHPPEGTSPPE